MSNDYDNIKHLASLIAKQSIILSIALNAIVDQACLLESALDKCSQCNIELATLEHNHTHVKLCDRCAAEQIYSSLKSILNDNNPDLNDQLFIVANEKNWVDVKNAEKIRRVTQYTKAARDLDVNDSEIH
jgi:hypothetical protein